MNYIGELSNLTGKKVLMRTDFDVPISEGGLIMESFRIERQKPAIDELVGKGAKVILVAHIAATDSFKPILSQLEKLIGYRLNFIEDIENITELKEVNLLDNIRRWPGEKNDDESFAEKIAMGCDLYVNNAFAVIHRKHASVSAITKKLPAYAGPLLEEELENLNRAITSPPEGKVIIIGGAKGSTKLPVIKNFLDKAEKVIVGGIVANDIILAKGLNLEVTNVDDNLKELLSGLDLAHPALVLPEDYNFKNDKILDIGPKSIKIFSDIISNAKMVIWNGPVGLFEEKDFSSGTFSIAKAVASSQAFKIVGGGDTMAAIEKLNLKNSFDFISTGGGAMLYLLGGLPLPGVDALNKNEPN